MIDVTAEPIDVAPVIDAAKRRDAGAIVTFVGVVRDDGIDAMEIEAFREMALADLNDIAAEATRTYHLSHVDIIHRTGRLSVGETILLIVCAAGHRKEAFSGCEEILDQIKAKVPIWKKEFRQGGAAWVEGTGPSGH